MHIWEKLHSDAQKRGEPILVLAPMADVTDAAFRRIIAKYGKPDLMYTEFVSADGLVRASEIGKKKLMRDLLYSESERPIIAQFFTAHPTYMKEAARIARELGFDGIDINMGCPDRSVEKQGAGAALIRTPDIARAVIRAAKEGAGDLPVSIKTRIGYNKDELETWLPVLLSEEPAAIIIHARTRKEMSDVPAQWERVGRAVLIRNEMKSKTLILGNGDVRDVTDAKEKAKRSGADGVMLGKAIFGNPWLFANPHLNINISERLRVMAEHTKLFEELLGDVKNFAVMKKHYKAYVHGFEGASEMRAELMKTQCYDDILPLIAKY